MKIYEDQNGTRFAFEDNGSQDNLISEDMILVPNEQLVAESIEKEAEMAIDIAKQARFDAVAVLKVTTTSGKEFNANEFSQSKLTTAISVLDDLEETDWKLADDSWVLVSKEELKEALRLAGEAQTTIWKGV